MSSATPITDSRSDHVRFLRSTLVRAAATAELRIKGRRAGRARPGRPIFIVGCPRSGTSLLFDLLRRHSEVGALNEEGHRLWQTYQHPSKKGWTSDHAAPADIRSGEAAFLYRSMNAIAGARRFLDKTPKNVMKISYLDELFPDALFVFVRRDGRATVGSLIEGWTRREGLSYRLPLQLRLAEYHGRYWSYILPPGWRDLVTTSIPAIAAQQFVASNEAALEDLAGIGPGRVINIAFEELLADPLTTLQGLLASLDLTEERSVMEVAERLEQHHVGSLSPPAPDKWRAREEAVRSVLPTFAPMMERLGYSTTDP